MAFNSFKQYEIPPETNLPGNTGPQGQDFTSAPNVLQTAKSIIGGEGENRTAIDPTRNILFGLKANIGKELSSGLLRMMDANSSSFARFKTSSINADRTYTLPDKSGTFALTSDITSGGDLVIDIFANSAYLNGPGFTLDNNLPVIGYTNNLDQDASFTCKVPSGATSISSMKVFYTRKNAGNLYLKFFSYHNDTDAVSAQTSDTTDTATTYASGGTDGRVESITIPSGAYNGLTIDADDIVTLKVFRVGTDPNDTYETAWYITHVQFTFA